MIQVDEKEWSQLVKDANDNRQIVKIIAMGLSFIFAVALLIVVGIPFINIQIQRQTAELNAEIAIMQANTNKRVMEIEREGLTTEEYFKWLEVRNQ